MVAKVKKKERPQNRHLRPVQKGTHPIGRVAGTPNKISRQLKDAILFAAEHESEDGTVEGYLCEIARNNKDLFVPLLGRLLPLQINARTQQTTKIVYSTVSEVRAALIARGLAPERADLLLLGKVPEPVEVLSDVAESKTEEVE